MKDKIKLQFSKRDDLDEKTKIELFELIDNTDETIIENAYQDYLLKLKQRKK
jgi:hypothetical protein